MCGDGALTATELFMGNASGHDSEMATHAVVDTRLDEFPATGRLSALFSIVQ